MDGPRRVGAVRLGGVVCTRTSTHTKTENNMQVMVRCSRISPAWLATIVCLSVPVSLAHALTHWYSSYVPEPPRRFPQLPAPRHGALHHHHRSRIPIARSIRILARRTRLPACLPACNPGYLFPRRPILFYSVPSPADLGRSIRLAYTPRLILGLLSHTAAAVRTCVRTHRAPRS